MKPNLKAVLAVTLIVLMVYSWCTYDNSSDGYLINIEPSSFIERRVVTNSLLDLTDFRYLLVPRNACKSSDEGSVKVEYVQIITSYAGEVIARSALRRAYPADELLGLGVVRVFLLARTKDKSTDVTQAALEDENRKFGDILQGSFYESYRNLTYKHVMGLQWASNLCPQIKYIMKMDDDIVVDLYRVLDVLKDFGKNATFDLMGYVFELLRPIRMKANKWYVTKQEYDRNYYPKFVSGWFYVTKPEVAFEIVERARTVPYFWIDDVLLTGIIPEILGSTFLDIHRLFTTYPESLDCCITRNVSCEFSVGPSGGDYDLQIRFQKHSKKCWSSHACGGLPPGVNISQAFDKSKTLLSNVTGGASVPTSSNSTNYVELSVNDLCLPYIFMFFPLLPTYGNKGKTWPLDPKEKHDIPTHLRHTLRRKNLLIKFECQAR